jgi:hypothetical protein
MADQPGAGKRAVVARTPNLSSNLSETRAGGTSTRTHCLSPGAKIEYGFAHMAIGL